MQVKFKDGFWLLVNGKKVISRCANKANLDKKIAKMGVVIENSSVGTTHPASISIPKSEFTVAERFEFIESFTKLVARGVIPSLVVTGSGGLGKTHTVIETLKKMGKKEDCIGSSGRTDFLVVSGYSTPRALYETLYLNRTKIIIYDDCDDVWKDPCGANILKAALGDNEKRVVSWNTASRDDDFPTRFEFSGKIIFISNKSMDKFPQAVLSRSILADITLTTDEKIERIAQVFNMEKKFSTEDKAEVIEFIRKNASKFKDLNIRSAFNSMRMKIALGEGWERMALYSATLN